MGYGTLLPAVPLTVVLVELGALFEGGATLLTGEGPLSRVHPLVDLQVRRPRERLAAQRAFVLAEDAGRRGRLEQVGPEQRGGRQPGGQLAQGGRASTGTGRCLQKQ